MRVLAVCSILAIVSCGSDTTSSSLDADFEIDTSDLGKLEVISNPKVAVNEVVHKTAGKGGGDWVELYNPGSSAVDIGGWKIKDSNDLHVFVIPEGTILGPKAFLLVYGKTDVTPPPPLMMSFALGDDDEVRLFQDDGLLVDRADWAKGVAPAGKSFGRYPDGTGPYYELTPPTPGAPNAAPNL